jgi:hypothetical protein
MFEPFMQDFTPDAPYLEGGVGGGALSGAPLNVINAGRGFAPFKAYTALTTTSGLSDIPYGSFSFRASNGTYYTFAGENTVLKRVSGTTWDDVSRTVGGSYTGSGDRWSFAAFGDRVIAVNYVDATQSYLAGTDTDFSALAGSPPKAKYIDVAGDFVVLGYVNDGTARPFRVQWSAQGDPTASWASSATTQADYQDMNSNYGVVTGISGFEDGFFVYQERAITPFYYEGSPLIFRRGATIPDIGCIVPSALVKAGGDDFFLSQKGFKRRSSNSVIPIGLGRVDASFWDYWTQYAINDSNLMTAFAVPDYPAICFAVTFAAEQVSLICYNYLADKFTFINLSSSCQGMCVTYSATYPRGVISGFKATDNKLGTFTGTAYNATFYTRNFTATEKGGRGSIGRIKVLCEETLPTSVNLGYYTGEFPSGGGSTVAMTAVGNNAQYTERQSSVAFFVGVTVNQWALKYRMHGVDVLEGTEDSR